MDDQDRNIEYAFIAVDQIAIRAQTDGEHWTPVCSGRVLNAEGRENLAAQLSTGAANRPWIEAQLSEIAEVALKRLRSQGKKK